MTMVGRLYRIIRINIILMRYNIDEIILGTHWFQPLRFLVYLNPYYWFIDKNLTRGERIRLAIEELGPIFVKVGQIVSTRRDLLPDDVALELAKLQDRVPPFPGKQAKQIVEKALGCKTEDIFTHFDMTALASASIAQVHAAELITGEKVVVKVLRPDIRLTIERDVDLLMILARLANRYWYVARHFKPEQIVQEVAQTLYDELDLMREAANASQLRRNLEHTPHVVIPKIYWEQCRNTILVMERIYGIPLHDVASLRASGVNLNMVAKRGIELFFTQIFRDSYFHADLHPGNIFISADNPKDPIFMMVDFGIVGSLSQTDQRYIAENMVAFFKRDYQRVAELHIACGWLPPDTRIDQFEGAIRAVSEPIFEQPLHDISFGKLLLRLFQVARRFNINIQPQLVLLQKTLLHIEALSRQLAPDLDLWATAAPQIEKWLKRQVGVRAFFRRIRDNLPLLSEQIPEIPGLIYTVLHETKIQQEKQRFKQESSLTKRTSHKTSAFVFFAAGVVVTLVVMHAVFR